MPDNSPNNSIDKKKPPKGKPSIKGIKTKLCYKCGEPVSPEDTECPHCGAKGGFNSAVYVRIILGFLIGFFLWLIFWR